MKREEIIPTLEKYQEYIKDKLMIDDKRILGTFALGSMNYGLFDEELSDVDSLTITVPTMEDIVTERKFMSLEILSLDKSKFAIKDIREFNRLLLKQNLSVMQVLYTDYFVLNPEYEELFKKYYLNKRGEISSYDVLITLKSNYCSGKNAFNKLEDSSFNSQKNKKLLLNAWRLADFCLFYLSGCNYKGCLIPEDRLSLPIKNVRNCYIEREDYYAVKEDIKKDYQEIENILTFLKENNEPDKERRKTIEKNLIEGAIELIKNGNAL